MLWPQQADLLSQFFVNLSAVADQQSWSSTGFGL